MIRKILMMVTIATLATCFSANRAHAWAGYHAGYTHVGPHGAYHAGTTRVAGGGAYGGAYHAGGVAYGGAYRAGGVRYGGAAYGGAYHYSASYGTAGYAGGARVRYGYVR